MVWKRNKWFQNYYIKDIVYLCKDLDNKSLFKTNTEFIWNIWGFFFLQIMFIDRDATATLVKYLEKSVDFHT